MSVTVPQPATKLCKAPWVEVDLDILADNIRGMQAVLDPHSTVIFVVKADAYGHGVGPVARTAWREGVRWFAVAYVKEALELRQIVPEADILVMGVAEAGDVPELIEHRITTVVVSEKQARALSAEAERLGQRLRVHLKVDTGMGRLGVLWQQAPAAMERVQSLPGLELTGLMSHFATIKLSEPELAENQVQRMKTLEAFTRPGLFRHISSSRAFLYHPEWDYDGIRAGIGLYGYGANEEGMRVRTRPILQWKTRVIQVKDVPADFPVGYYSAYRTPAPTKIGTISVGYADGYQRLLTNTGSVVIRGERCRVVGRISMNWVTVDLGPDSDVCEGDEVALIGQQGDAAVWAGELAKLCSTIPYEILTSIDPRAQRRYTGGAVSA